MNIRLYRISYLCFIIKYRKNNRVIIYLDESYIHAAHIVSYCWSDNASSGLKAPVSKGKGLIVVHTGSDNGFAENVLLNFQSGSKSGDCHSDIEFCELFQVV